MTRSCHLHLQRSRRQHQCQLRHHLKHPAFPNPLTCRKYHILIARTIENNGIVRSPSNRKTVEFLNHTSYNSNTRSNNINSSSNYSSYRRSSRLKYNRSNNSNRQTSPAIMPLAWNITNNWPIYCTTDGQRGFESAGQPSRL